MGRLHEFFDAHRDNVEEAVSEVLKKADSTIESLDRKVKELERRLRDVAGEEPVTDERLREQQAQEGVVTSDETNQKDQQQTEAAKPAKTTRSKRQ